MEPPIDSRLHGLKPSATLAINERTRTLRREGHRVFAMGFGQSPFPVPDPVVKALRSHAGEKDYLPVAGLWELREAVAEHHRRVDGIEIEPEGVLIGPGSKELMFLLALAHDAEILLPTPCWVSYGPQARLAGRQIRLLETRFEDDWKLDPGLLERHCAEQPGRARTLILNHPSNPHGGAYTLTELQALGEAARRSGVLLLSDEIYGELHHQGAHVSAARAWPEGTIVSNGLSKWCGAGGWRLGTFAFPRALYPLRDAIAVLASETFTSVCAPVQYAAIAAFRGGPDIEQYLAHSRRILAALADPLVARFRQAGLAVSEPLGAFYLFPDFSPHAAALAARGITDSVALCDRLLEEAGVALLPGSSFQRPPHELTARLSYVDFDGRRALAASQDTPLSQPLPQGFCQSTCPDVLGGAEAIVDWLGA